jgi:hypothetical protein
MHGVSRCVCDFVGASLYHSSLEGMCRDQIRGRWEISASHNRKIKPKRAINEMAEPTEDTAFHWV